MAARRGVFHVLTLVLALSLLSGCGKRGALVPPEALVPAPVSDLALAQKGGRFQVSWSAPSRQEGGGALSDLAGFLLLRRVVLPPGEDCEECPSAYSQLAKVDLDYPQGARQLGNLWLYDDFDLKAGRVYQYKLRSFTTGRAQSKDSNRARRTVLIPPLPPVLEAQSSATEVTLSFVALPPEQGTLLGYNIYRSKKDEELPLSPLNPAPVTGNTYRDRLSQLGVSYSYAVTSVAELDGETVESAPSNLVEGTLLLPD